MQIGRFRFFVLLCVCAWPRAQAHDLFRNRVFDLRVYAEKPGYDFNFKSPQNKREVMFSPNAASLSGVGMHINGFVGLSYGFKNPIEKEQLKQGETTYEDWRFSFAFTQIHLSLNYQRYKGFFVKNTSAIDPSNSNYLLSPDLRVESGSVNLTYIWAPQRFSLQAAMEQTARQSQSGGSMLLGLAASHNSFSDSGPILPLAIRSEYGADQDIEEGRFLAFTAKIGYGYTWAWTPRFYSTLAAQVGGGPQQRNYKDAQTSTSSWHTASKFDAFISTGFNGDRIFTGAFLSADATSYKTSSLEITANLWAINLFLGGRF